MLRPLPVLLALATAGCESHPPVLTVHVAAAQRAAVDAFVAGIPMAGIAVVTSAHPAADAGGAGMHVALVADLDCAECYRLEESGGRYLVHGGDVLGLQYGLADLLERAGLRFLHPQRTFVPERLEPPAVGGDDVHAPALRLRGLHLHTLHPVEAYFDLWGPDEAAPLRILDWVVKNRGNYLQWCALEDALEDGAAWRARARALVAAARERGVSVGIAVQLFGQANLQHAFDLIDADDPAQFRASVETRLHALLDDVGFARVNLSFGEFFASDPAQFVATLDMVTEVLAEVAPGTELTATVHVGNYPDMRVQYQDETLLYYFLVKYADPSIVPWVHSVMYYDLFEDAGGAYLHDQFDEHREYLLDRLRAGQRAAYFPESAYWVAFDNSVPTYLPLYVRSRWVDLAEIAKRAAAEGFTGLEEHVLFSSGWEWGYWQNDYATLRMTWELPERWQDVLEEAYLPLGAAGAALARAAGELGELQHQALIVQRLAPYLAGRDVLIDAGDRTGIVSQPDRPSFEEVVAMDAAARAAFVADVLEPLDALAAGSAAILDDLRAAGLPPDDPWAQEMLDGVEVDVLRARFAHAAYRAAVAHAEGAAVDAWLAEADGALDAARTVVARRHAALHDPEPGRLLTAAPNTTLYAYGYLFEADTLCYWERERATVRRLVLGTEDRAPPCFQF